MSLLVRSFVGYGALSLAALMLVAAPASGQLPAGHKITGGYKSFWSQKSASRRMYHARDYAAGVHEYLAQSPQPDPKVVLEQTAEVLANLDGAKKHFAEIRKENADDKETIAAIDRIEKHLTAAMSHHGELCACCEGKDFAAIQAMECCNEMTKEIDAALKEHDALMRQLATKAAAEGKQPKAKAKSK